jgi:hypothetical protein
MKMSPTAIARYNTWTDGACDDQQLYELETLAKEIAAKAGHSEVLDQDMRDAEGRLFGFSRDGR